SGTWHDWLPAPRLSAYNVTMGNPDWSKLDRNMAEIGHITFSVNPIPLLSRDIIIPTLQLDDTKLVLERIADGRNNWTFKSDDTSPSTWTLDLQHLLLHNGEVSLKDAVKHIDAKAEIASIPISDKNEYAMEWKVSGSFNNARISGDGKAGALLALRNEKKPFPLQARLNVGKTSISVNGTVTRSEERRVGKECRSGWRRWHEKAPSRLREK